MLWGRWCPRCLPRASGARIPAVTRSLISEDSSSAMAPMMVNIARPMQIKVTAPALPRALSRLAAAPYDACEKRAGRVNGLAFTDFWE